MIPEEPSQRPNPDLLLARVQRDEQSKQHGRLKIFFGMCPGVGKTYAMLEAARALRNKGTDILVGVVETHGRSETAALLDGLPLLPRKKSSTAASRFRNSISTPHFRANLA